jgi:hypothetical protein
MQTGFTSDEIDILMEAVTEWTTASKTGSMLAGLFMGAMVCGGDKKRAGEGKDAVKRMMDGEDEKQKMREEQAILLKAKLIQMRDQVIVSEISKQISSNL